MSAFICPNTGNTQACTLTKIWFKQDWPFRLIRVLIVIDLLSANRGSGAFVSFHSESVLVQQRLFDYFLSAAICTLIGLYVVKAGINTRLHGGRFIKMRHTIIRQNEWGEQSLRTRLWCGVLAAVNRFYLASCRELYHQESFTVH